MGLPMVFLGLNAQKGNAMRHKSKCLWHQQIYWANSLPRISPSNDTLAVSFRAHYAAISSPAASVSSTTLSPALRIRRKPAGLRLTSATFSYRWFESEQRRIIQLYQCLLRAGWMAQNTNPDDFLSLFSGRDSNCKIHWTGKKTYLVYLFKLLTDRQYISTPKGVGRWMIVSSHFIDAHRRIFTHLNSQRTPLKAQHAIAQLAELLNAATR